MTIARFLINEGNMLRIEELITRSSKTYLHVVIMLKDAAKCKT